MQIWAQLLQQVDHPVKKTQKSIGARSGYANFDLQITNTKVALTKHDEWKTKFKFLLAIMSKMGRGIFTFERRRLTFKQFEQSRQRWPELRWFQKTESSENKVNILEHICNCTIHILFLYRKNVHFVQFQNKNVRQSTTAAVTLTTLVRHLSFVSGFTIIL